MLSKGGLPESIAVMPHFFKYINTHKNFFYIGDETKNVGKLIFSLMAFLFILLNSAF